MIQQIASIFGTRMFVRVLNVGLAVLLARALGPVLQGQVTMMLLTIGIVYSFANLGLDAGAIYFVGRMKWNIKEYSPIAIRLILLSSLAACTVLLIVHQFELLPAENRLTDQQFLFLLLMIPLENPVILLRYLFLAKEDFSRFIKVEILQSASLFALVFVALVIDSSTLLPVLIAYVLNRVLTLSWLGKQLWPELRLSGKKPIFTVLSFSVHAWMTNLFSLMNVRVDALMVAWFAGKGLGVTAVDVGLYTICVIAISRLKDIQNAIQTAFFPKVAGLEHAEAAELTAKVYRISFPVYVLMFAAILVLGYPVLVLFGPDYPSAYSTLAVLAMATLLIRANSGVISIWFTAIGKPKVAMTANAIATGINFALNVYLIPKAGILGAACATLLSAIAAK